MPSYNDDRSANIVRISNIAYLTKTPMIIKFLKNRGKPLAAGCAF